MNTLLDTLQYFVFITIELIALFMLISAAVEIILMYIPEETIRKKLSGSGIMGNVIAVVQAANSLKTKGCFLSAKK